MRVQDGEFGGDGRRGARRELAIAELTIKEFGDFGKELFKVLGIDWDLNQFGRLASFPLSHTHDLMLHRPKEPRALLGLIGRHCESRSPFDRSIN